MGGGSSLYFGPETLIEKDVVVVTFNYRFLLLNPIPAGGGANLTPPVVFFT